MHTNVSKAIVNHPGIYNVYGWFLNHQIIWVVYDIALLTLVRDDTTHSFLTNSSKHTGADIMFFFSVWGAWN